MARPKKKPSSSSSPPPPATAWTNLYGVCPGIKLARWQVEAWCFKTNPQGGLGRFQHLKNWLALTWPLELREERWNPWTERTLRELCSDENTHNHGGVRVKVTTLTGNATASKAQPLDVIVYTASGPKQMGELKVGDLVVTPDGSVAPVLEIHPQGMRQVFEVGLSDGASTRCCRDHLWEVYDQSLHRCTVVDTAYLLKNFERYSDNRNDLTIPFTEPVAFNHKSTRIHPYLLGVVLGDGTLGGREGRNDLSIASMDEELLSRIREIIGPAYRLRQGHRLCDYAIAKVGAGPQANVFKDAFRSYGLWGLLSDKKFIPEDYLYNDVKTRWEVLRGLMDTDGHVARRGGQVVFNTTSYELASGVRLLVQSLGGTCRISEHKAGYKKDGIWRRCKNVFNCYLQIKDAARVFHLKRKQALVRKRKGGNRGRKIVSVRFTGFALVQCILIDHPRHLYLTDYFIATHNTWSAGMFAFAWFACSPHNSLVAFTSTTKDMIKRRIWPVVQHFYDSAVMEGKQLSDPWAGLLNKVESKTTVQFINPNGTPSDLHAIFALAVADGETQKACHNLRGMHAERVLLVVDELNGTPEAIMKVIPNLRKGCRELQIILIGNPISHLDPHGRACRPAKGGFSSVTEQSTEWVTEGVDEWQLESGTCLRFDGRDSPNVKLGIDRWPFIYTNSDWFHANKESRKKTLAYWQQDRGLWPPDGFSNTIITETMLEIYDPPDGLPFTWKSHKEGCAFLDSGFGGDACKLYLGEFGDIEDGKTGVQILESLEIKFELNEKTETRDYKIARQCMEECKLRGIASRCFGLDRTGTGRGVAAIICAEWSDDIVQVEYGGQATDRPSSTADGRPSHEVYTNRVCEMHWSLREFLEAGQLRGIPHQARIELSTREYSMVGRRYKLESKEDYKARVKTHSPDDGDCATGIVDVVRMQGVNASTKNIESAETEVRRELKAAAQAQEQITYSTLNAQEEIAFALQTADSSVADALESW